VGPSPVDLPVLSTTLSSDSGSRIATWYVPAEESHATVVLIHSFRGDRRSMLGRARLFRQAGYAVVLVDLQAHGESPGDRITIGLLERHDVRAAVSFARARNPDHRIGVVACSLGGAAVLFASPLDIDAAVLESVYPTISEAVHNRVAARVGRLSHVLAPTLLCQLPLRLGISADDLCPIDHIAAIGCPVLLAAGDADRHTTLAETQRIFAAAMQPKQLVVFRGAAHVDLLAFNTEHYKDEILPFFAAHLAPEFGDRDAR
jgi:fermentation-respiration switch protein FrsA (DUF1100 family)